MNSVWTDLHMVYLRFDIVGAPMHFGGANVISGTSEGNGSPTVINGIGTWCVQWHHTFKNGTWTGRVRLRLSRLPVCFTLLAACCPVGARGIGLMVSFC